MMGRQANRQAARKEAGRQKHDGPTGRRARHGDGHWANTKQALKMEGPVSQSVSQSPSKLATTCWQTWNQQREGLRLMPMLTARTADLQTDYQTDK